MKDEYKNWLEAKTYVDLQGIKRKKMGQLLNTVEKFCPIDDRHWGEYLVDYEKINATFEKTASQSFFQKITCNS